jgi:hypothetical protein
MKICKTMAGLASLPILESSWSLVPKPRSRAPVAEKAVTEAEKIIF